MPSRRGALTLMGAAALTLLGGRSSGGEQLFGRLIEETRDTRPLSRRIAVISAALRGKRYRAETLIGGPRKAEVFVVRDDVFDCVTYAEAVLAAARAAELPQFEGELRKIRYHNGTVDWRERNHDFAAWCARNVANGVCRPVALGNSVALRKVMTYPRALGRRNYELAGIPRATLLAEKAQLQDGDIIGFISRRAALDYFHCGFVMFGGKGELLLRHASQSRGRVSDQTMESFLAINGTQHVTVLRPVDPTESTT
ncbi:MAG TPA: N-acetylmuramoyl-L-alanine amidase-like domain-containing protein [Vicinamibacterales bacterium]|nr:N-acetylmuramoyl-L-alanine amidase-like domain-containing protein [Vicinamibacterales bacterium]